MEEIADLVSLRVTSNIEFILSIFARNDTCSERSEDTKARSWRNASCSFDEWIHNNKVAQVVNAAHLQLLHFQAELRAAAMHQRVEGDFVRAFLGCRQKSAGIATKFCHIEQTQDSNLASYHTNWPWLNAAETGSPEVPSELT